MKKLKVEALPLHFSEKVSFWEKKDCFFGISSDTLQVKISDSEIQHVIYMIQDRDFYQIWYMNSKYLTCTSLIDKIKGSIYIIILKSFFDHLPLGHSEINNSFSECCGWI